MHCSLRLGIREKIQNCCRETLRGKDGVGELVTKLEDNFKKEDPRVWTKYTCLRIMKKRHVFVKHGTRSFGGACYPFRQGDFP